MSYCDKDMCNEVTHECEYRENRIAELEEELWRVMENLNCQDTKIDKLTEIRTLAQAVMDRAKSYDDTSYFRGSETEIAIRDLAKALGD
jgi:hypothetical protein